LRGRGGEKEREGRVRRSKGGEGKDK